MGLSLGANQRDMSFSAAIAAFPRRPFGLGFSIRHNCFFRSRAGWVSPDMTAVKVRDTVRSRSCCRKWITQGASAEPDGVEAGDDMTVHRRIPASTVAEQLLRAGRLNSPFAKTLLARRRVDFATGLLWLCDRWKSGAFTGGAIDFCPCLFWFRPFHEIPFAEMMKAISGCSK
jgi:hypothetical protein